ncbi:MAG: GntR family transcriptional regulator, partial [Phycisphaeraceae bacterium]
MSTDTGTHTGSHGPAGTRLYAALADRLRRAIQAGVYRPGQLLGSEHSLAKQESISRMTVRRASELLVKEGLIERRPGKGLYVRDERATTRAIQVVAGNLQWEPSLQASRGIQSIAAGKGVQTQLYDAHGDVAMDLTML